MLCCILTFILSWMSISFIGYMLSDVGTTFRQVATNGGCIMFMIVFGWLPCVIVAYDLDNKLS